MAILKVFIIKFTQTLEMFVYRFPWAYNLFNGYYDEILDNEIELANISKGDKILCVGGGPCPFTAIELHKKTGAKILVIDNDYEAIKTAKLNIKKMKLSSKIKVCHCDGKEFSCENFDIVHIALQVCPKEQVFNQILNNCKRGAKILVRCPKSNLKNFYSNIKEDKFPSNAKIYHKNGNTKYTSMYMKTGGFYEKVLDKCPYTVANHVAS